MSSPSLHSTPPFGGGGGGGFRQNIAVTFGTEKLESCGYPMVKKIWRYIYSFWQNACTNVTDTRARDRRTDTASSNRMRGLGHRIANFPNYVTLTSSLTHHRIVNLGPTALRPPSTQLGLRLGLHAGSLLVTWLNEILCDAIWHGEFWIYL